MCLTAESSASSGGGGGSHSHAGFAINAAVAIRMTRSGVHVRSSDCRICAERRGKVGIVHIDEYDASSLASYGYHRWAARCKKGESGCLTGGGDGSKRHHHHRNWHSVAVTASTTAAAVPERQRHVETESCWEQQQRCQSRACGRTVNTPKQTAPNL